MPPTPLSTGRHRSRRATAGHFARGATRAGFSLLAALIAVAAAVSSFEIATAPAAARRTGPPCTPATSRTRASSTGTASTTRSPPRTSPHPARRINIQVSTSTDGVNWTALGSDATADGHSARGPSSATPGHPRVAYDSASNEFVMYYTATEASTGDQCIGIATAPVTSPLGPYTDPSSVPVVCQNGKRHRRHHRQRGLRREHRPRHLHRSQRRGRSWLIWKSDGNNIGLGQRRSGPSRSTSDLLPP